MKSCCLGRLRWSALTAVVAIWAASLALPALAIEGAAVLTGWDVLRTGWQGAGVHLLAW